MKSFLRILLVLLAFNTHLQAGPIDTSTYRFYPMPEVFYHGGIQSITKDSLGRMWYNGRDVLFMYDGSSSYQMNEHIVPQDPMSYFNYNQVWTDKDERLYIATSQGLLYFNYSSFQFEYILKGGVPFMTSDKDGNVWIIRKGVVESFTFDNLPEIETYATPQGVSPISISCIGDDVYVCCIGKIYRIDKKENKLILLTDWKTDKDAIRQIVEYKNKLYALTYAKGMYVIDKDGAILKHYNIPFTAEKSIITKNLYLDSSNILWISTQLGIFMLDLETEDTAIMQAELYNRYSLPQNSVWSIYPDPDGGVWLGTFGGRLVYMNPNDNMVDYIGATTGRLNNPIVSCFQEDKNGNIWIGTEGGGVNLWNRSTNTFTYHTQYEKNSINFNLIKTLRYDPQKENLQIAAFNGGISQYNTKTQTFRDLEIYYPNSTRQMNVYDYVMEADSGIWLTDPDAEFYYKDLKTSTMKMVLLTDAEGKAIEMQIECMYRNAENNELWLITHQGIYIMDIPTRKIINHHHIKEVSYPVNFLHCYCVTADGDMWVGTFGGGVNKLSKDGTYTNFNAKDGFHAQTVFGILEDTPTGDIWFSTDDGIYYYGHADKQFHKPGINTPSLCGSFYTRSNYKTSKGEMLFGGTNGFIMFTPEKIKYNIQKPEVFFTDFYINNQKVTPQTYHSPISKDISVMAFHTGSPKKENKITLSHKQSNFEIRFSSDSYLQSDKNIYAYRMVGLSNQWYTLNKGQRSVQFFSLPAGTYTFEVRAANNDRVWGDKISALQFRIKPSPFLSVWAYMFYTLCALGLIYLIWRYYANKKTYEHQLEIERIKEQNMKELIQVRINFFTNISHDLKTPLTLVMDPLKRLKDNLSPDHPGNPYVHLIERNVNRIQRMISQLLQFREIESKKITPNLQSGDLMKSIADIFSLFDPYAKSKKLSTNIQAYTNKLYVSYDPDLIEKIFSNLISNAIKYSPAEASVNVDIQQASAVDIRLLGEDKPTTGKDMIYVSFEVTNTGTSIADDKKAALFKSFSRLSHKRPDFEESTGLGLSIVKELVDTLNGKIIVNSDEEMVSFRIVLPFSPASEEVSSDTESFKYAYAKAELKNILLETEEQEPTQRQSRKKHSIVIVEDDATLRQYMEKELSKYYNVYTTTNGLEGIDAAESIYPQVVITDLMMPEADGFEVCRKLRANIKTSHIPIIILSALGGNTGNKIKGLKEGADVFIEKPFDMNFLLLQVDNMIKSRNQLKELYSKKYIAEPSKVTISSIDEELLKKAMTFIESNIDNSEYDVEAFVSDMGIGRTLLYQKINDIVGMSIKEFILDVRLKRSAQLLTESEYTIAEIAYLTGFNEGKYFSVCFKKHFGVSPSEFKKKKDKQA